MTTSTHLDDYCRQGSASSANLIRQPQVACYLEEIFSLHGAHPILDGTNTGAPPRASLAWAQVL